MHLLSCLGERQVVFCSWHCVFVLLVWPLVLVGIYNTELGIYHGASVIILSTFDWNRSSISRLELDAVPHSWTPYVQCGSEWNCMQGMSSRERWNNTPYKCQSTNQLTFQELIRSRSREFSVLYGIRRLMCSQKPTISHTNLVNFYRTVLPIYNQVFQMISCLKLS